MTQKEFVAQVAVKTGESQTKVKEILKAASEVILDTVVDSNQEVTFMDLGTFKPKVREARTGRNPRTGEAVEIKEMHSIAFKASRGVKSYAE